MVANDSKPYLFCLNKSVDEWSNTRNRSFGKKSFDADYSTFIVEIETNPKSSKFKVGNRVRITKVKNILRKSYTNN